MCLDGLGVWVLETLDKLSQEDVSVFVSTVAYMLFQLAHGMHEVVAKHDSITNAGEKSPLVLPHELARVGVRRFSSIVNVKHKTHVQAKFNKQQSGELNQQFGIYVHASIS